MSEREIEWVAGALTVRLAVLPSGAVGLSEVRLDDSPVLLSTTPPPLVEIGVVSEGRSWSSRRYVDSVVGGRARLVDHSSDETRLVLHSVDDPTGLSVRTTLVRGDGGSLRVRSTLVNTGVRPVHLTWVSSATLSLDVPDGRLADRRLWHADNDWLAENRWQSGDLRSLLPDVALESHQHAPRGCFERTARGGWSTDGSLPVGVLVHDPDGTAISWQVEHNGAWHWQLGERPGGVYASLLGPTETEHGWFRTLAPRDTFDTVPVTLTFTTGGIDGAAAGLTLCRRHFRRRHVDETTLPVVYNDYMNTLMGDPTTAKLQPLIEHAAAVGAEVFCIDAGWYDDDPSWWEGVGAWEPATGRFPGGLSEVVDLIRDRGMVPGLWLEPEVVGVGSPVAKTLPDQAFFVRGGERVVENGRYHLDLRHPAALAHLDEVVDRLVATLGIGYFKLDYNINPGAGTDSTGPSLGAGLLGHSRALLDWLDGVARRHPLLTLENCASGGMRVDYAMLSRLQLQSTSDQQDYRRYPPISAAAAMAITPEQAASWSYPQPEFSDDAIAYTMSTGLLGRLYLSGHLDRMTEPQLALVTDGVTAFKRHRDLVATAVPFWPLGLPGWEDGWVAHGVHDGTTALVTLWRRDTDDEAVRLSLPWPVGDGIDVVYPVGGDATATRSGPSEVEVRLPRRQQAVTVALHHSAGMPGS